MQNGSEQVCNDEKAEVSELVGDGVGFDKILACEDALDLVFCDDTETLVQNKSEQDCDADVGGMPEPVEDRTVFDVIRLPCEDAVDLVFCDDTETLMQNESEQDCEAEVGDVLELGEYRVGVETVETACVVRGDPVD